MVVYAECYIQTKALTLSVVAPYNQHNLLKEIVKWINQSTLDFYQENFVRRTEQVAVWQKFMNDLWNMFFKQIVIKDIKEMTAKLQVLYDFKNLREGVTLLQKPLTT